MLKCPQTSLPRLGLESVDSFNCAHGEVFLCLLMQYFKPHLSYEQQANLLISRGLVADYAELVQRLQNVGYYRLSAYWHPFRQRDAAGNVLSSLVPGTTLARVWLLYRFDRDLRLLILDAIERIEVALRSRLANSHTKGQSPFAYASASYFPHWRDYLQKWDRVRIKRDRQGRVIMRGIEFLDHFYSKYGDCHDYPPLWMSIALAEMGFVAYFYDYSDKSIRGAIAKEWKLKVATLSSWLHSLNIVRNDCAHHARVWNKEYYLKPHLPSYSEDKLWYYFFSPKISKWVAPPSPGKAQLILAPGSVASILFICRRLLRCVAPTSHWHQRVEKMLHSYAAQGVDLAKKGLPAYWEQHPLWK